MSTFFVIFLVVIYAIIGFSSLWYFANGDKYGENIQGIRKIHYALFLIFIIIGMIIGELDVNNWKLLGAILAVSVFVDLAVFQTPNILKFGNAEFEQFSFVRKTLRMNEELMNQQANKVERFTDIVNLTSLYFQNKYQPTQWRQYKDDIRDYLNLYADTFQFHIAIFEFDNEPDSTRRRVLIEDAVRRVELCYNKKIEDEESRNKIIDTLNDGSSLPFIDKGEDKSSYFAKDKKQIYVVAYYGDKYNMLIGISSDIVNLDGVDASHILNMAQIFDWHMVS